MSHYTIQADVMSDGNKRKMSEVGVINQRYLVVLKGNEQKLEVNSNQERLRASEDFKWSPNVWYRLKAQGGAEPGRLGGGCRPRRGSAATRNRRRGRSACRIRRRTSQVPRACSASRRRTCRSILITSRSPRIQVKPVSSHLKRQVKKSEIEAIRCWSMTPTERLGVAQILLYAELHRRASLRTAQRYKSRYSKCFCATLVASLPLCAFALMPLAARAQDWPQWGGTPARNMYCPATGLPDHFTKGELRRHQVQGHVRRD